jgi:hypothetical protein
MKKTLQSKLEYFIQFSEEELEELNISSSDTFDVTPHEDGFLLEKRVPLDINLEEFDICTLKKLVSESLQCGLPVNDIIVNALKLAMDNPAFYENFNE